MCFSLPKAFINLGELSRGLMCDTFSFKSKILIALNSH